MRIKILLLAFLLIPFMSIDSPAQEMPLVYDVENTCADCPDPYMPTIGELPTVEALPDPFEWSDGSGRIFDRSDWRYRRAEIGAEIEHYEIGEKPARPDTITASFSGDTLLTVNIIENGDTLTLTSQVVLPEGDGPFPAVIGMTFIPGFGGTGSLPSDIFTSRNIATIEFVHNDVTTYGSQQNTDPYYQLYPHLNATNTGQYSAWAWGVSRLIDGLELVQDTLPIDLKHLAVTGCSYAGKMALFAGAFDERIALTIAQESGGGGAPAWRVSETLGNVERLGSTDHNWFRESMFQFANANVSKLPEDHHELMAMCAPRALLVTGNTNYEWLANPSCYVSARATQEVYNSLGTGDRFGFFIDGGHNHCAIPSSQRPAIEAFVDKFLLGDTTANTDISTAPYNTDLAPWIAWTTPILPGESDYADRTSLIHPSNHQTQLDTAITFVWNHVETAEKYFFELATDPAFRTIVTSDSLTDTTKTVTGLSFTKRYYWRVQAKNSEGALGPWSGPADFVTFTILPEKAQLVSSTRLTGRADYIRLRWRKVDYADEYVVQASTDPNFTNGILSSTTPDTSENLSGTIEGEKFYWRVAGKNIGGLGPWSDVWHFTIVVNPTGLRLEQSDANQITLTWRDNSDVEEGYVIERKVSPDTSFTIIDTLKGSWDGSERVEYVDNSIEQSSTHTYRVKAYKDSVASEYSREASINITGIKEAEGIPTEYSLSQNYPNPFNPSTTIKFALPERSLTKITIYDLLGREIRTLIDSELEAGNHEINVDAGNLPSGVYLYRIQSGYFSHAKKMILIK